MKDDFEEQLRKRPIRKLPCGSCRYIDRARGNDMPRCGYDWAQNMPLVVHANEWFNVISPKGVTGPFTDEPPQECVQYQPA